MKRVSNKRARLNRQTKPLEDEYRCTYTRCQICFARQAAELHHMPRGPGKVLALGKWPCLLHLCQSCHLECTESRISMAKQCAYKLRATPECFDLDVINSCLVKRVDAGDVLREMTDLLTGEQ